MTTIHVDLAERGYDIQIVTAEGAGIGPFARSRSQGTLAFVVGDQHVAQQANQVAQALEQAGFRTATTLLPAGEQTKDLHFASRLYDELADHKADRKTLIVAVGGGVVGDLAGFVAATFNRGLSLLMVPTTLLAMVDSSVGGKVGINHPRGKNLIGAFHQPIGVWIDTSFLDTLPDREYRSGLAEVVKYGVILDPALFAFLETSSVRILERDAEAIRHIVARSCRLKADIVEQDEDEQHDLRAILNYGHTFGHAFETVGGYGVWLHGEAVSMGMVCASRLAERRGLIAPGFTERERALLDALGLPSTPPDLPIDELIQVMRSDKKAEAGRMRFILPRQLGIVGIFSDVPEEDVRAVLRERSR